MIATFGCLIIVHILMCIKEAREHLGRFLKRYVSKYKSTIAINESSLSQSEDGKIYFYYGVFPVIMIAVGLVTIFDIYFYWKYHYTSSYSDKKFLYLFPIPIIAPIFFVINLVMSGGTTIRLFCWDEIKKLVVRDGLNEATLNHHENTAEKQLNKQDKPETHSSEQKTSSERQSREENTSETQSSEQDTPETQSSEQDTPETQSSEQDTPETQSSEENISEMQSSEQDTLERHTEQGIPGTHSSVQNISSERQSDEEDASERQEKKQWNYVKKK